MKRAVRITANALADIDAIRCRIVDGGAPATARQFVDRLLQCLDGLQDSPGRCPLAPEANMFVGVQIRQLLRSGCTCRREMTRA